MTNTHAKFSLLSAGDWRITIKSSMNLNQNRRFEHFDIDDDVGVYEFFHEHITDMCRPENSGIALTSAEVERYFDESMGKGKKKNMPVIEHPLKQVTSEMSFDERMGLTDAVPTETG